MMNLAILTTASRMNRSAITIHRLGAMWQFSMKGSDIFAEVALARFNRRILASGFRAMCAIHRR
jgi:hypothetical protein